MSQNDSITGARTLAVPGSDVEDVVDGEIVDETAQPQPSVLVLKPVIQTITVVIKPEHARAVARHVAYVLAGLVVAWRRYRRARNLSVEMGQMAKLQGDHANGLLWAQQAEAERQNRHARGRGRTEVFANLVKVMPLFLGLAVVAMAVLNVLLFIATRHVGDLAWSFLALARAVEIGLTVARVLALVACAMAPIAAFAVLHELGRRGGGLTPGWALAAKPGDSDKGLVVTADTIVLAMQNIPVPELKKAFRDGWRPSFTLLPVRDGRGYEAEFSVPLGVTPDMIADRRPVLARNLHRDEIEVWPSAGAPGYTKLWVADRGAIGKAAPEYPLLHVGEADVFAGVPGGVIARGDGALIPVVGNNGVLGGMMGQGKSNGARVLMLGCATDPLCSLDVFTFANNGDFDAYAPRLAVYRKGLDDDVIGAAIDRLRELYQGVAEREQILADLGAKKVTRELARQYPELRPHVALFSECHELFGHPEYGDEAGELAVKTAKRARKTAEVLWFDTQSSRKSAIPPALVELVSVNCCFAVKSWRSNDGFLGDGSFAAGIRATELRHGRDRGTSLVTGISDAQFELLKWYFVEVDDDTGYDAAAEVIERTMRTVAHGTPVAAGVPPRAIEQRDLLDDLAALLEHRDGRARLSDLPGMLRDRAPSWGPYRGLNGAQLRELLTESGVRTTNTGNVPSLDPADLRRALAERVS